MIFGLRRLKLAHTLSLISGIPVALVVLVAVIFPRPLWNFVQRHPVAVSLVSLVVLAYAAWAWAFARRLAKDVEALSETAASLARGDAAVQGRNSGVREIESAREALAHVQADILRQTQLTESIRGGRLDATYAPRHANDKLGQALLAIKENLVNIRREDEQRQWAAGGLAKFVEVLQTSRDVKTLSLDIMVNLVRIVQANQGAIFIVADDANGDTCLEMQACYAYHRTKHLSQRVAIGEGLIGQAFLEKETIHLKDVPDRFVRITSGLGEANPRYILIVPLRMNESVVGIIELASFSEFRPHEIAFVEKIGESIAHTVSSFRTAESTRALLAESQAQAEQMRAQEEELRQNQEELQATQEEISRKYDALFDQLTHLNYQARFDQLKSITSTKKHNVEYYFDIIRNQITTFSKDRMIVEAVRDLRKAFKAIGHGLPEESINAMRRELKDYYTQEFLPRLGESDAARFVPTDTRCVVLQHLYIAANPHPTGQKSLLESAGSDSDYARLHAACHPIIRNFLEKFGYYDIFLIDAETGDMVYSVFKEVDFATNLLTGLYSTTNFGKVVRSAVESTDTGFVQLIDFEPYAPSYHAPASFIACPVYEGSLKTGILVFQMPINRINQILTGNNRWREDGLGETGETFIVGNDFRYRSISRQLIENPKAYLAGLQQQHYDAGVIRQIERTGTNILLEKASFEAIGKALKGATGTLNEESSGYLNAYAPLDIPDVQWAILSTMREEEASERIQDLRQRK